MIDKHNDKHRMTTEEIIRFCVIFNKQRRNHLISPIISCQCRKLCRHQHKLSQCLGQKYFKNASRATIGCVEQVNNNRQRGDKFDEYLNNYRQSVCNCDGWKRYHFIKNIVNNIRFHVKFK